MPPGPGPIDQRPQAKIEPIHQAGGPQRLLGNQRGPQQQNENAGAGGQQEKESSAHGENPAADGEDLLVQGARPMPLAPVEMLLEALAWSGGGKFMPVLFQGVEHGESLEWVDGKADVGRRWVVATTSEVGGYYDRRFARPFQAAYSSTATKWQAVPARTNKCQMK